MAWQDLTIEDIELEDNEELFHLLPLHSKDEAEELKKAVVGDGGFTDAIKYCVWEGKNITLDGRNRMMLWSSLPEDTKIAPPQVKRIELEDGMDPRQWILRNQLARRNLTPQQKSLILGDLYNKVKAPVGKPPNEENGKQTLTEFSEEYNENPNTVRHDAKFATAMDKVREVNPKFADDIVNGDVKATKESIIGMSALNGDGIGQAIVNVRDGKKWDDEVVPPKKKKKTAKPPKPEHTKHLEQAERLAGELGTAVYAACNLHEDLQTSTFDPCLKEIAQLLRSAVNRTK